MKSFGKVSSRCFWLHLDNLDRFGYGFERFSLLWSLDRLKMFGGIIHIQIIILSIFENVCIGLLGLLCFFLTGLVASCKVWVWISLEMSDR